MIMKTTCTFLLFITLIVVSGSLAFGQAAETTPNGTLISNQGGNATMPASAILEMRSTNKGMLPPRMTTAQINAISGPTKGLMAYDTDLNCLKTYDGSKWECLGASSSTTEPSTPLSSSFAYQSITDNYIYPRSIAVDNLSNSVSVGHFRGAVTFGKNTNSQTLTSQGEYDIYIVKHDANGNLVWATQIGGAGDSETFDVEVDNAGNVAVLGYIKGTSAFFSTNGSTSTFTNNNYYYSHAFVARYNDAGVLQWFRTVGSSGNYDCRAHGVTFDSQSNIIFTGYYRGTASFSGQTLSSISNTDDIFVAKLNASGTYLWVKTAGGSSNSEWGSRLTCDNLDNVYLYGWYTGTSTFGENTSVVTHTARGENDSFIAKYDPNGSLVWAKTIGSIYTDYQGGIAFSPSANCLYICGSYKGTMTFGPGLGTNPLASVSATTSYFNGFVAKYDLNGNVQWSVRQGSSTSDHHYTNDLAIDASGNPYITGTTQADSRFYTANSADYLYMRAVHYSDPFIAKYNTAGALQWSILATDGYDDSSVGIAIKNNTAFVVGTFKETINFAYQQIHSTNNGYNGNLFIWRYSESN